MYRRNLVILSVLEPGLNLEMVVSNASHVGMSNINVVFHIKVVQNYCMHDANQLRAAIREQISWIKSSG